MSNDFELQLPFKGGRSYIQGPDIYNGLCDVLHEKGFAELEKIDLVFHKVATAQLSGRIYVDEEIPEAAPNVLFRFRSGGQAVAVLLHEDARPVTLRVPYDEEALIAESAFDAAAKQITVLSQTGFSNIETFVALNKSLLLRCFPEAKGRWLFARLQLAESFRQTCFQQLEVQFLGHSNFRITRSALIGDGKPLGHIYFSLLPTE